LTERAKEIAAGKRRDRGNQCRVRCITIGQVDEQPNGQPDAAHHYKQRGFRGS
jgi:hypothetical protein